MSASSRVQTSILSVHRTRHVNAWETCGVCVWSADNVRSL